MMARGFRKEKHFLRTQPLTPTCLQHVVPPAFLFLFTSYLPMSSDGPAAACSTSGSCWHGRLLGPLPLPSSRFWTGGPSVYWRSDWMPRCRGRANPARELCSDSLAAATKVIVQNTTHMPPRTCCNKNQTGTQMSSLCGGKKGKHMHAQLHPHTGLSYCPGIPAPHPFSGLSLWYKPHRGWDSHSGNRRDSLPTALLFESLLSVWTGVMLMSWHLFHTHQLHQRQCDSGNYPTTHPAHVCIHPNSWVSLDTVVSTDVFLFLCDFENGLSKAVQVKSFLRCCFVLQKVRLYFLFSHPGTARDGDAKTYVAHSILKGKLLSGYLHLDRTHPTNSEGWTPLPNSSHFACKINK